MKDLKAGAVPDVRYQLDGDEDDFSKSPRDVACLRLTHKELECERQMQSFL